MGSPLAAWQNYYVIVGSAAAALIGIQFVVITLIAYIRRPAPAETVSAFGTPTVVHLAVALLISAVMSAPWSSLMPITVAVATCGLGGLAYGATVIVRARRQTDYQPVWEDWAWYLILPFTAYAALAVSAVFLSTNTELALFVIAGSALGVLLIAIHNAWDTITHIVVGGGQDRTE